MLKIEVGKVYVDGYGDMVDILAKRGDWYIGVKWDGKYLRKYSVKGMGLDCHHICDLTHEYIELKGYFHLYRRKDGSVFTSKEPWDGLVSRLDSGYIGSIDLSKVKLVRDQ